MKINNKQFTLIKNLEEDEDEDEDEPICPPDEEVKQRLRRSKPRALDNAYFLVAGFCLSLYFLVIGGTLTYIAFYSIKIVKPESVIGYYHIPTQILGKLNLKPSSAFIIALVKS